MPQGSLILKFPGSAANCASQFLEQEKKVLQYQKPLKIFDLHPYANHEWRAFLTTKMPYYDKDKQLLGISVCCKEVKNPSLFDIGNLLSNIAIEKYKTCFFPK